jgi:hypothetical protein
MMQFDLRVTIKEYNEITGQKEEDFEWDSDLMKKMKEELQTVIAKSAFFVMDDKVFVSSVSDVSLVP